MGIEQCTFLQCCQGRLWSESCDVAWFLFCVFIRKQRVGKHWACCRVSFISLFFFLIQFLDSFTKIFLYESNSEYNKKHVLPYLWIEIAYLFPFFQIITYFCQGCFHQGAPRWPGGILYCERYNQNLFSIKPCYWRIIAADC